MYKKILLLTTFAAALFLGACSSSDDEPGMSQEVDLSKLPADQRKEYEDAQKYLEPFGYKNTSIRFLHVYPDMNSNTQLSGVKDGREWVMLINKDGKKEIELYSPVTFSDVTSYKTDNGTKSSTVTDLTTGNYHIALGKLDSGEPYTTGIIRFEYKMSNGDTPYSALYNSDTKETIFIRPMVLDNNVSRMAINYYILGQNLYNKRGELLFKFSKEYPPLNSKYESFIKSATTDGLLIKLESIRAEKDCRLIRMDHVTQTIFWEVDMTKLFEGATKVTRYNAGTFNGETFSYIVKVTEDGKTTKWRITFDVETGKELKRDKMII